MKEGFIRIRHRDGHVEERYDPVAADLIRRMRELDRQVLADCIEDEHPNLAAKLRTQEKA
jgi:hypothetical protein